MSSSGRSNYWLLRKAAGDTTSRILMYLLTDSKEKHTGVDIRHDLDLEQSQMAHRLSWLYEVGLVGKTKRRSDRQVVYWVKDPSLVMRMAELAQDLRELRK